MPCPLWMSHFLLDMICESFISYIGLFYGEKKILDLFIMPIFCFAVEEIYLFQQITKNAKKQKYVTLTETQFSKEH